MMPVIAELDRIVIEEARAVAAIHVADPLGFCLGCVETAARLACYPCAHKAWAATVLMPDVRVGG